jgi:hypothetical protein
VEFLHSEVTLDSTRNLGAVELINDQRSAGTSKVMSADIQGSRCLISRQAEAADWATKTVRIC